MISIQFKKQNLWSKALSLGLALGLTSGCSTFKKNLTALTDGKEALPARATDIESFRASEPDLPELEVAEFDQIPEEVQPMVQKWLNYFQGRGREHMERYLSRATRYERLMKRILRENGVPEDIIYIALIESGFSPRAISRARAVGYWQFIRGTGKRYGLAINTFVDERRDPVLATQAAADYFKGLYSEFNSWFLSMASYNVGEGRVRREINRIKNRDFWALAQRRRLPKETINYVPKFLAARLIARKPEAYGFKDIPYEPPIEFETIQFQQAINMKLLADKLDVDYAEIKRLNPKYRGEIAPVEGNKLELRLPLNMKSAALAVASDVAVKDLVFVPDRGETDVYKVRSGDNLLKIARRFKTSVAHLREINDFKRRSRLRPGRTIFVPIPVVAMEKSDLLAKSSAQANRATAGTEKAPIKTQDEVLYTLQEGESLAEVAIKNNMTMEELMELNSFSEGQVVTLGMQLKVRKIQPEAGEPSVDELPTVASGSEEMASTVATTTASTAEVSSQNAAPLPLQAKESGAGVSKRSDITKPTETVPSLVAKIEKEAEKELFHTVQPGETLFKIAQQYKTTVSALKKANKLRRRKVLRAGAVLKIPHLAERRTSGSSIQNRNSQSPMKA